MPIPGDERVTRANYNYAETYLDHLNGTLAINAAKYRFHIANNEERKMLISAKLMRPDGKVQRLCLMKGILYSLIKHLMVLV